MTHFAKLLLFLSACPILGVPTALAQEPALLQGYQGARFTEAPDVYHYILPCQQRLRGQPAPTAASLPTNQPETLEAGLCIRAVGEHFLPVGDKFKPSPPVSGQLAISLHLVRFIPDDPAQMGTMLIELNPEHATVAHTPGKSSAILADGSTPVLLFVLRNICIRCAPNTPLPSGLNDAQLDREFALLADAIKHFDTVAARINQFRINSGPG